MRKLVWAAGIVLGILLVAGLVLSLAVRSYLSSERLKALLIPRLEEFTGRQVAVEDIDVSLFTGIVVKGISIKQRDGKGDFARTEQFILNYSLMPLLRRQLVIEKVEVVGPYVFIRREKDGSYNFSDIVERRAAEGKKQGAGAQEGPQELPLSIVTNRITLKDARLEFADAQKALPQVTAHVSEGRLTAAVGRTLGDIDLTGSFDIKNITAVMGALKTATAGTVEIKNEGVVLALTTRIGDDTVKTTGTISGSLAAPSARIDIAAKELDLEKLLALTGGAGRSSSRAGSAFAFDAADSRTDGQRAAPIVLVAASPAQGKGDLMRALTASGMVKVDTGRYGDYRIKDFSLKYRFEKGVMRLEPISLHLSGGAQVAVEGSAAASALFRADVLIEALGKAQRKRQHDFGAHVIPDLVETGKVFAYDFGGNCIPGAMPYEERGYWRDVGAIQAYFDAHMDMLGSTPPFELDNELWPIHPSTYEGPAAKILRGDITNSIIAEGALIHNAVVRNSVIRPGVVLEEGVSVEDSIIMEHTVVRKGARLRRVIVDKHNIIPEGDHVGFDPDKDRFGCHIDASGIAVIPRGGRVIRAGHQAEHQAPQSL